MEEGRLKGELDSLKELGFKNVAMSRLRFKTLRVKLPEAQGELSKLVLEWEENYG
jgi:hypothetical protein